MNSNFITGKHGSGVGIAPCCTSLICTVDPIGISLMTSNENCMATVSPPSKGIGNGDSVRLIPSI